MQLAYMSHSCAHTQIIRMLIHPPPPPPSPLTSQNPAARGQSWKDGGGDKRRGRECSEKGCEAPPPCPTYVPHIHTHTNSPPLSSLIKPRLHPSIPPTVPPPPHPSAHPTPPPSPTHYSSSQERWHTLRINLEMRCNSKARLRKNKRGWGFWGASGANTRVSNRMSTHRERQAP